MSLDWIYYGDLVDPAAAGTRLWTPIGARRRVLGTNWDWILAIVFLVITVRVILFPVFVKQIKSQRAMQALQPQIKELQEKHKGDRQTLQKEMMELYAQGEGQPADGLPSDGPPDPGLPRPLPRAAPSQADHAGPTTRRSTAGRSTQFDSAVAREAVRRPDRRRRSARPPTELGRPRRDRAPT